MGGNQIGLSTNCLDLSTIHATANPVGQIVASATNQYSNKRTASIVEAAAVNPLLREVENEE